MEDKDIDTLFLKHLKAETSFKEDELVYELLKDVKNQNNYDEIKLFWNSKIDDSITADISDKKQAELNKLNTRIDNYEKDKDKLIVKKRDHLIKTVKIVSKVAAIIVLLLLPISIFYSTSDIEPIIVSTRTGERLFINLPDGSGVHLNSETTIFLDKNFNKSNREIILKGEAYFDIIKDSLKPFIIHTDKITTKVLGTSFNTKALDDENQITISLVEGKVEIYDSELKSVETLKPSEQFVFHKGLATYSKNYFDKSKVASWRENQIIFDGETLEEIGKVLKRLYGVEILFSNEKIKKCTLKATFKDESLNTILEAIKFAGNIKYTINNKKIILSGDGC